MSIFLRRLALVLAQIAVVVGTDILLTEASHVWAADQDAIQPISHHTGSGNPGKVGLGGQLFRDPILSNGRTQSCSSCHDIDSNGSSPTPAFAHRDSIDQYNVPSIFNVGLNFRFGWRGDYSSLEDQNDSAIQNSRTMKSTWPEVLDSINTSDLYRREFASVYGEAATRANILDALVSFQMSLTTPAPFDAYLEGDESAISVDAKAGYRLFRNYGCVSCHQGLNIGGNMFQKFGVFDPSISSTTVTKRADLGRVTVTGRGEDTGVFRVPSLRNVAVTGPYLHDGRSTTLPAVIQLMGWNQLGRDLDRGDVAKLVEFLKTLTGAYNGRQLHATSP